jgi:hypothetical protein
MELVNKSQFADDCVNDDILLLSPFYLFLGITSGKLCRFCENRCWACVKLALQFTKCIWDSRHSVSAYGDNYNSGRKSAFHVITALKNT